MDTSFLTQSELEFLKGKGFKIEKNKIFYEDIEPLQTAYLLTSGKKYKLEFYTNLFDEEGDSYEDFTKVFSNKGETLEDFINRSI